MMIFDDNNDDDHEIDDDDKNVQLNRWIDIRVLTVQHVPHHW